MLWNRLKDQAALATGNFVRLFRKMEVPTLPQVTVRLLELADAEDVEITEVASVIASDAGLTSKVIRTVNSVQMSLQKQITDIHQAVAFMGIKRIYSLALAYSAVQALPTWEPACEAESFWQDSLQRAALARTLASRISPGEEGVAFTDALLQNVALPILLTQYVDHYRPVMLQAQETGQELVELEESHFSWTHAQAGAWMARNWGFPDVLVCCIGLHHLSLDELVSLNLTQTPAFAVAISSRLPDALPVLHDALGMDDTACQEAYQAADAACTELADLLDVPVPTPLAQLE